jgi:hypothetical protein
MICLKRTFFRSRSASGENGQNDAGHVRQEGHSKFLQKGGPVKAGQNNCSPWFCPFCRAKALCGKEAFLLQAFLVTFVATKVTGPARPTWPLT